MSSRILQLTDVTFRRREKQILDGIDLAVRSGEHWALLGPNGSGKTALLRLLGAVTHPTTGSVEVLGYRLGRVHLELLRRRIGHVNPSHPLRSELSALGVVLTGFTGTIEFPPKWRPSESQVREAQLSLTEAGLAGLQETSWQVLSQGERGRVLIARALVSRPPLLLLDEPTTGLDVAAREQFLVALDDLSKRASEVTTVLVTHHLEELPTSTTHALLISHGRTVAAGKIDEVVTTRNISSAFEYPLAVGKDSVGRWSARAT